VEAVAGDEAGVGGGVAGAWGDVYEGDALARGFRVADLVEGVDLPGDLGAVAPGGEGGYAVVGDRDDDHVGGLVAGEGDRSA